MLTVSRHLRLTTRSIVLLKFYRILTTYLRLPLAFTIQASVRYGENAVEQTPPDRNGVTMAEQKNHTPYNCHLYRAPQASQKSQIHLSLGTCQNFLILSFTKARMNKTSILLQGTPRTPITDCSGREREKLEYDAMYPLRPLSSVKRNIRKLRMELSHHGFSDSKTC